MDLEGKLIENQSKTEAGKKRKRCIETVRESITNVRNLKRVKGKTRKCFEYVNQLEKKK